MIIIDIIAFYLYLSHLYLCCCIIIFKMTTQVIVNRFLDNVSNGLTLYFLTFVKQIELSYIFMLIIQSYLDD